MRLEDQVCTLEQAKTLRNLGIKQESLFYWIDRGTLSKLVYEKNIEFMDMLPVVSAFTVAELGYLLPGAAKSENGEINIIGSHKVLDEFNCFWQYKHNQLAPTEAQARAEMLIYLYKNAILSTSKTLTA